MSTKEKISEAAFLLSLERGFDNVSLNQIIDKSGAGFSSIYYHFKNKDDILNSMIQEYLVSPIETKKDYIRNFKGSFIEKLRKLYYYIAGADLGDNNRLIEGYDINYKEYYLMFFGIYHQHPDHREIFHDFFKNYIAFFKELIERSIKNGEIKVNMSSDDFALFIFTNIHGFLDVWIRVPDYSLDELIDVNIKTIEQILI